MNGTASVLVVDDDPAIRDALERPLRLEGFDVSVAPDGEDALKRLADGPVPDVVMRDVVLPGRHGTEVVRLLRDRGERVPVLLLSARDEVADRVEGLRAGADDDLVKPFALEELVVRRQALMRRADPAAAVPLRVADLVLDPARREVRRGDREIAVTNRESELLETTATSPRDATRRRPPGPWRFEGAWQPSGARG